MYMYIWLILINAFLSVKLRLCVTRKRWSKLIIYTCSMLHVNSTHADTCMCRIWAHTVCATHVQKRGCTHCPISTVLHTSYTYVQSSHNLCVLLYSNTDVHVAYMLQLYIFVRDIRTMTTTCLFTCTCMCRSELDEERLTWKQRFDECSSQKKKTEEKLHSLKKKKAKVWNTIKRKQSPGDINFIN